MEIFTSSGYLNGWLRHDERWRLFKENWPDWHVQFADLGWAEEFDWTRQIIWLDASAPHPRCRLAHAAAHLRYHDRGYSSRFTPREEAEADWFATAWMLWGLETPLPAFANKAGA